MLLKKYQCQQEKEYRHPREEEEYWRQCEEERYEREHAELHWRCSFFRYCWSEGLRLPNRDDCPECNDHYKGNRQP